MLCPKIEGMGYTAAIVPWRLCLREGLDHEKSLAHFSCNLRMEPTGSEMMIDGRESSQTPYYWNDQCLNLLLLYNISDIIIYYIFATISRFIWSFCFNFWCGPVFSNMLLLPWLMFLSSASLQGQPATSSAARGGMAANLWKEPAHSYDLCRRLPLGQFQEYVVLALRCGSCLKVKGWSGSEWDACHQDSTKDEVLSINPFEGRDGTSEATGVEVASRFSAGFGIYDNSIANTHPFHSLCKVLESIGCFSKHSF